MSYWAVLPNLILPALLDQFGFGRGRNSKMSAVSLSSGLTRD